MMATARAAGSPLACRSIAAAMICSGSGILRYSRSAVPAPVWSHLRRDTGIRPNKADPTMPLSPLDDAELAALIVLLREEIAADRFPFSPRVKVLRGILAKLAPQPPRPEPLPPPKPPGERSMALTKKRRR